MVSIRCSASLCSPASAAVSRDSNRSVTPETAEWTTTGRSPSVIRWRSTPAILCQLETDDTLVPPNLSTTQEGAPKGSIVFEDVAQLFFQLPLSQHVLDSAPGSLAAFARRRRLGPAFRAFHHRIKVV